MPRLFTIKQKHFHSDKIPAWRTSCSRCEKRRPRFERYSNREKPMLSATLQEGLETYAIGPKLRALRLKKKMGLVELGRHTGLSAAMLSKIERGQLFPTLPTLLRIALVFSVGLDHFFSGARTKPVVAVVRPKDRLRFPERPEAADVVYEFESLDFP